MNLNLSVVHTYKLKFAEKGMSNNEMYKMAFVSLYGIEIKLSEIFNKSSELDRLMHFTINNANTKSYPQNMYIHKRRKFNRHLRKRQGEVEYLSQDFIRKQK